MMDQPWGYAAHGEDLAEGGQGEFPMQPICRGPADLDTVRQTRQNGRQQTWRNLSTKVVEDQGWLA